ncbi:UNVERIFIED_CONTAM: TetR/AcrR family transcriptional regulator, partial [Salmonella enterica subsp. enterica serovar Weltevreden]
MQKSSSNTRKQLLDAAETVVRRDGVSKLTLDAVAKEAGVSKGGILYHFSGKELLIQGMLERLSQSFETEMETLYAQE